MKSLLKLLSVICFFAVGNFALFGQQPQFIPLNVDHAAFDMPGDDTYVEFYLSCLQSAFQYEETDSGYVANFSVDVELSQNDSVIQKRTESFLNIVESQEKADQPLEMRHVFPLKVEVGEYNAKINVRDLKSGTNGEYLFDLNLQPIDDTKLGLSDIELSVRIKRDQRKNRFNKHGLQVIPNPSGLYSITMPVLYYYAEAYNFPYEEESPGTYTLKSYITDREGNIVKSFPTKQRKKPGKSAVIVGGNNIVALESDTYFFHLKVIDDQIGDSAKSSKRFTLFKPSKEQIARTEQVRANSNKLMLNYYSSFSEEELDEEFAKAEYIATDEEKKIFKDLNKSGKAEFLANFWNKRDANKESPHNEYRIEYFQLVEYASEKFQTKFREGWKTDRGRVLLTYGAPNDIERSPMQQNKKPYEVWSYDKLEGGCIFVFADLQGFGDYDLIHSTYSQEISHPDWQDLVRESSERDQLFDGFRQ